MSGDLGSKRGLRRNLWYGVGMERSNLGGLAWVMLALSLNACSNGTNAVTTTSTGIGTSSGSATTGGSTSAGTSSGTSTGGTTSGGSTTGDPCAGLSGGGDTNALDGPLAFNPVFAGSFSRLLPDGGPNPANLNVVLSTQDLSAFCGPPPEGGYSTPAGPFQVVVIALSVDAGTLPPGCFPASSDNGFMDSTIALFTILGDSGVVLTWISERGQDAGATALVGSGTAASGGFQTLLTDNNGGTSPLAGFFFAPTCQGLVSIH